MELSTKSSITFSITGILSNETSSNKKSKCTDADTSSNLSPSYSHSDTNSLKFPNFNTIEQDYAIRDQDYVIQNQHSSLSSDEVFLDRSDYKRHHVALETPCSRSPFSSRYGLPIFNDHVPKNPYDGEIVSPPMLGRKRKAENRSTRYQYEASHDSRRFQPESPLTNNQSTFHSYTDSRSNFHEISHRNEHFNDQQLSSPSLVEKNFQTLQNGRFRPPPFFDTVLVLRKRLYFMGGKVFPTDEPPSDRNIHKLWRSMEKQKVNYSLQHYFYVASLSNRCFDLVERIYQKVSCGFLEGSREKEVNQSYFNFLYGKTEEERYNLLRMLESGQISPKDVLKSKQSGLATKTSSSNSTCHNCKVTMQKMSKEKDEWQNKYNSLKRKYDEIISSHPILYRHKGIKKSKSH